MARAGPRPVRRGSGTQHVLAEHPELILGVTAEAVTRREFQSAADPAEVVVVDGAGQLPPVEGKLAVYAPTGVEEDGARLIAEDK